jgi:hypothetical protein
MSRQSVQVTYSAYGVDQTISSSVVSIDRPGVLVSNA